MENFSISGVGGIIEKTINNIDYILVQDRCKNDSDCCKSGLIEIPAGKIRAYENIFHCLRREIQEETGLNVLYIEGETETSITELNGYKVLNYMPFSCCQNIEGTYPIMVQTFICKAEGELLKESNETQNIRWVSIKKLKEELYINESRFYPMHISTLKKYFKLRLSDN